MEPFKCAGATAPGYHISRSAAAATTTRARALARDRVAASGARAAMEDLADMASMLRVKFERIRVEEFFLRSTGTGRGADDAGATSEARRARASRVVAMADEVAGGWVWFLSSHDPSFGGLVCDSSVCGVLV